MEDDATKRRDSIPINQGVQYQPWPDWKVKEKYALLYTYPGKIV